MPNSDATTNDAIQLENNKNMLQIRNAEQIPE
jgi:hypothetical protein